MLRSENTITALMEKEYNLQRTKKKYLHEFNEILKKYSTFK